MLEGNNKGIFKWEQIKYIGIGNINQIKPDNTNGDCKKIIDLIYKVNPLTINSIRIQEEEIQYNLLFKDPPSDREQNFRKLINILINYSKAPIIPETNNKDIQHNYPFSPEYKSLKNYEADIISSLV